MVNLDRYLDNKAFELTSDTQANILNTLKGFTDKILQLQKDNKSIQVELYRKMKDNYIAKLERKGIKVAYGWIGHHNEWFFPTEEEVYLYEDWLVQCSD